MKLYLIMLQGQGDTHIKLVRKDGWDALNNGIFGPALLDDYAAEYHKGGPITRESLEHLKELEKMSGGSAVNDVALNLPGCQIDGKSASFYDLTTYTTFIRNHPEIEVVDEYAGYIY